MNECLVKLVCLKRDFVGRSFVLYVKVLKKLLVSVVH